MSESFLFYDLETFGTDPRRTRIAQFAAIRTTVDLEPIGEPESFFVKPANDLLPSPGATLVTGIAPQQARQDGVPEADAIARIAELMSEPGTCSLGYNSLRFDDEFIRFGLYRNFHDPYEREWRNGNSRWDLLDVVRLMHALRPEGLAWRTRDDGEGTSFRLEHLAADNGLREGLAHEALSDVRALIGLARRLRTSQPRLWDYALKLRDKRHAGAMLDVVAMQPVLHVSQKFHVSRLCAAPVVALTRHPRYDNRVIVFDLATDPEPLLSLSAEDIRSRVFVRQEDLPDGVGRIPLKEIHLNKSPMLVSWPHLRPADLDRLQIDAGTVATRAALLRRQSAAIGEKVRTVFDRQYDDGTPDADAALYAGFLPDSDRRLFTQIRGTPPHQLGTAGYRFRDARVETLLFRYRARNWPHLLTLDEQARWNDYRRERLAHTQLSEYSFDSHRAEVAALRETHAGDGRVQTLLDQCEAWARDLQGELE